MALALAAGVVLYRRHRPLAAARRNCQTSGSSQGTGAIRVLQPHQSSSGSGASASCNNLAAACCHLSKGVVVGSRLCGYCTRLLFNGSGPNTFNACTLRRIDRGRPATVEPSQRRLSPASLCRRSRATPSATTSSTASCSPTPSSKAATAFSTSIVIVFNSPSAVASSFCN